MVEIDKTISELLESKGITVLDRSEVGKNLDVFESQSFVNSNNLFTFLVENNLNRYLFGFFLRTGTLEVGNLPFHLPELNSNFLSQNIKETFIKKFECKNCDQILFRKHTDEIDYFEPNSIKCPICDTTYDFSFNDLEDDFSITRNDLVKYLNRLAGIGILTLGLKYVCPTCKRSEDYNQQQLDCLRCGSKRELLNFYSFKDEFFNECLNLRDGRWFEWYVFKMCSHIFPSLEHNLIVSFEEKGIKRECEIDVLSINQKGEIVIFECKDYLKRDVGFGEMENLVTLSPLFTNINFISSLKINKNAIRDMERSIGQGKVNFIEGVHLEKQYLSEDNILNLFSEGASGAINLYSKLNDLKRRSIILELIKRFNLSDGANMASALSEIFWGWEKNLTKLMAGHNKELNEFVKICYKNILNKQNVIDSATCLKGVITSFGLKTLLDLFTLEEVIKMGKDYLPLPYQKRRALYYFYWSVFNFYDGAPIVSSVISRDFIKKFIPMLDIYYGEGSREITLKTIKLFWNFADDEDKQNFINISKSIIESPLGSAKGKVIDFVVDKIDTFSKAQKSLIVEAFKKYLEQNPSSIRKGIIEGIIIKIS